MQDLTGKTVEVITVDTVYTGVLVEIGTIDVYLQAETECIVIPVEKILDIKEVDYQ